MKGLTAERLRADGMLLLAAMIWGGAFVVQKTGGADMMSLEGVFGAAAGALLLHERLTSSATCGCVLIMLGVVLIEIIPLWRRRTRIS